MRTLTVKIPEELDVALRAASQRRRLARSELVREALHASLADELRETSAAGRWLARWSGRLEAPKIEDTEGDAARLSHLLQKHVK